MIKQANANVNANDKGKGAEEIRYKRNYTLIYKQQTWYFISVVSSELYVNYIKTYIKHC